MDMLHGIEARFWAKVRRGSPTECWEWTGQTDRYGYGHLWIPRLKTVKKAHRLSYEHHVAPIPDGLCVCHHCDNPPCVNPSHLFVGTQADNVRDKLSKNRQTRGETHGPSKLTRESVVDIRTSDLGRAELAEKYGISVEAVSMAATGATWGHVDAPTRNRSQKLSDEDVRAIRSSRERGVTLAARYSVRPSAISRIRNGTRRASA